MKIWEARLILRIDENDKMFKEFTCVCNANEFEVDKNNKSWKIKTNDKWIRYNIPMNPILKSRYNISVTQGFDHELNQEELKNVEMNMRKLIKEKLDSDMEVYRKQYEKKLKVLEGEM